jgi:hypothetical protein
MPNFKTTECSLLRDTTDMYEVSLCKENYKSTRNFACSKHYTEIEELKTRDSVTKRKNDK